ncbi:hypothetical protein D3C83_146920 [compost metagenome]
MVRKIDSNDLPPIDKDKCPHPDYAALIEECWSKEPHDRPTFQQILNRIILIEKELKFVP